MSRPLTIERLQTVARGNLTALQVTVKPIFARKTEKHIEEFFFNYLPELRQSVQGHSAAVWTGNDMDMQWQGRIYA